MLLSFLACAIFSSCGCPEDSPYIKISSPPNSSHGAMIKIYSDEFDLIKYVARPGEQHKIKLCELSSHDKPSHLEVAVENQGYPSGGLDIYDKFKEIEIILNPDGTFKEYHLH